MLLWGETAQGHVRAVVIVGPHPLRGEILNIFDAGPVILRQPFIAHCPVETFDVGILLGLARLDIFNPDAPFLRPALDRLTDVFGPVVHAE